MGNGCPVPCQATGISQVAGLIKDLIIADLIIKDLIIKACHCLWFHRHIRDASAGLCLCT